jgi:hypothetical protein
VHPVFIRLLLVARRRPSLLLNGRSAGVEHPSSFEREDQIAQLWVDNGDPCGADR